MTRGAALRGSPTGERGAAPVPVSQQVAPPARRRLAPPGPAGRRRTPGRVSPLGFDLVVVHVVRGVERYPGHVRRARCLRSLRGLPARRDRHPHRGARLIRSHETRGVRGHRVVYLVRDPRSVVLSEYRWQQMEGHFEGGFDAFLADFLDGSCNPWGSWGDHVRFWLGDSAESAPRLVVEVLPSCAPTRGKRLPRCSPTSTRPPPPARSRAPSLTTRSPRCGPRSRRLRSRSTAATSCSWARVP